MITLSVNRLAKTFLEENISQQDYSFGNIKEFLLHAELVTGETPTKFETVFKYYEGLVEEVYNEVDRLVELERLDPVKKNIKLKFDTHPFTNVVGLHAIVLRRVLGYTNENSRYSLGLSMVKPKDYDCWSRYDQKKLVYYIPLHHLTQYLLDVRRKAASKKTREIAEQLLKSDLMEQLEKLQSENVAFNPVVKKFGNIMVQLSEESD